MCLPRWLLVPGLTALLVSVASAVLLKRVIGLGGYDLSIYLMGGNAMFNHLSVYDQLLRTQYGVGHYAYPPVTLLVFGPLSLLPLGIAHAIMLAAGFVALVASVWIVLRWIGVAPGPGFVGAVAGIAAVALWLQPVFDTLDQGQINLVLMALVIADLAFDGHRRWPSGVLIGIAAAAKITPMIFIVYLLLTGRKRAAGVATATAVALTALGFLAAPADSVRFWLHGAFADTAWMISPVTVDDVSNQSLNGVLLRLVGAGAGPLWLVTALVVGCAGLAVAVAAYRRDAPLPGMLACAVTGLLVSPLSWHEHWVWIVPVLIWLGACGFSAPGRHPTTLVGLLPVVPLLAFLMWPQPYAPGQVGPASVLSPARHLWADVGNHHPLVALAGSTYVVVGLILLAAGGVILIRTRARSGQVEAAGSEARTAHP